MGAEFSDEARRARVHARHHLAGDAADVRRATAAVVALHATDPATVFLSVLARCRAATLEDVAQALYDDRSLVRLMAMRRTLFVVPRETVPVFHHGAALEIAATVRKRLLVMLATTPTDPVLPEDLEGWLAEVEQDTVAALAELGSASGSQLSAQVPALRTALLPTSTKAYDVKRNITTQVLTVLGAQGRMVRARPRGAWASRHHTWEPARRWWPEGIEPLSPAEARARLVEAYLARFGPATESDVAWWTGWSLRQTRAAIAAADLAEVSCSDGVALVVRGDASATEPEIDPEIEPETEPDPNAPGSDVALLPALDPTPMGWKDREWFLPPAGGSDRHGLYDRSGNIGRTIWWRGEVIGGWAIRPNGQVVTQLLLDRGADVAATVATEAERLTGRLGGRAVTPAFPTPLEKALRTGD